jgi:hypothetical protein
MPQEPGASTNGLPYLDTHTITVALGPEQVWQRTCRYADGLGIGDRNPLAVLLGTDPRSGFAVTEEIPGELVTLAGRHRFARYELVFQVEPRTAERTTLLHAHSYAEFPGAAGRAYRALVIGTGLHVVATTRMLHQIART